MAGLKRYKVLQTAFYNGSLAQPGDTVMGPDGLDKSIFEPLPGDEAADGGSAAAKAAADAAAAKAAAEEAAAKAAADAALPQAADPTAGNGNATRVKPK